MIDTHCHLNFKAFDKDLDSVVRRFIEEGGEELIVVGAKTDSSEKAIKIASKYPKCWATAGIHPHHLDSITSLEQTQIDLEKLVNEKKVVAVGETGLDYYHYKNYPHLNNKQKENQQELFRIHLTVASKYKLPVIIHCREAQSDLLNILTHFLKTNCLTGVLHCFSGDLDYLNSILSLGFYIGFDGNITYPENEDLRLLVKKTPLKKLLIETDAPYLTPLPHRGKRNEPAYLNYTIHEIAKIKKETENSVINITSQNARLLFKLN